MLATERSVANIVAMVVFYYSGECRYGRYPVPEGLSGDRSRWMYQVRSVQTMNYKYTNGGGLGGIVTGENIEENSLENVDSKGIVSDSH